MHVQYLCEEDSTHTYATHSTLCILYSMVARRVRHNCQICVKQDTDHKINEKKKQKKNENSKNLTHLGFQRIFLQENWIAVKMNHVMQISNGDAILSGMNDPASLQHKE